MTDNDRADQSTLIKTDALGRVRTTKEQREALLDAFEAGGLSGPDFVRVHGINYQTFATWRQKRKRERGEYEDSSADGGYEPGSFTLIEAEVPDLHADDEASEEISISSTPLCVELPCGALVRIRDASSIALAVELIKELVRLRSC